MATKRQWDSVINHWTRLSSGKTRGDESIGPDDCAFCRRYWVDWCQGCPIREKTGHYGCNKTPYGHVLNYVTSRGSDGESTPRNVLDLKEFKALAKKELEFLKKLRKEVRGD